MMIYLNIDKEKYYSTSTADSSTSIAIITATIADNSYSITTSPAFTQSKNTTIKYDSTSTPNETTSTAICHLSNKSTNMVYFKKLKLDKNQILVM